MPPVKERRCDLGAACVCRKAGWKGECFAAPVTLAARPRPLSRERQVEARLLGPGGESMQVFDLPDELTAIKFVDLLRHTSYCRAARVLPLTGDATTSRVAA